MFILMGEHIGGPGSMFVTRPTVGTKVVRVLALPLVRLLAVRGGGGGGGRESERRLFAAGE